MSSSNNPKAFYNQPDYSGGSGGSSGARYPPVHHVVHKPDEISASDLLPPPPYSPDNNNSSNVRKSSDSSTYGSTAINEQQAGLLGQSSQPPFLQENRNSPKFTSSRQTSPYIKHPTSSAPSSNPHLEYPTEQQSTHTAIPVAWNNRRRNNGDPGCCRNWCKYIFAAFLVWLVLLKYGELIFPDKTHNTPHDSNCSSNSMTWDDLPRMIDFERNVEVILEGYVSGGTVVVTPLEDRYGGTIITDVKFTPSALEKHMTYQVEQVQNDVTRLILKMPTKLDDNNDCIDLNMEIRLPYSADLVRLDVHNVDVSVYPFVKDVRTVDIQNANGNIRLDRWTGGRQIKLVTKNGGVKVGRLISDGSIYLETTNGEIVLSENIEAKSQIDIQNTNGAIKTLGSIQADDTVNIESTNGLIHLGSVLSDTVFLKTSNAGILVDYIKSKLQIIAQTSNGPIAISIAGEKNNKVTLTTSSNPINLHMTKEFEGHFVMSTSNGKVTIDNDEYIEYQDDSDELKRGERRGSGNKGDLSVSNSNADVNVSFDI